MRSVYYSLVAFALIGCFVFWVFFTYKEIYLAYERAIQSSIQASIVKTRLADTLVNQKRELKLAFVGDIMLSREVGDIMLRENDFAYPFRETAEALAGYDLTFGNLEGPISAHGRNQGSIYSFRADPRVVEGLAAAGFNVLSLANNHIWDWGRDALADTVTLLGEKNIATVGAGRNEAEANAPAILRVGDVRVGFLAYTDLYPSGLIAHGELPGISDFSLAKATQAVADLKRNADIVVVSFHWGDEYKTKASANQRKIAHALIDAGADIIAGHHPHVVEETEQHKNGWIAYSLGNFIFDMTRAGTTEGLLLEVTVNNKSVKSVTVRKVRITMPDYIPVIAD